MRKKILSLILIVTILCCASVFGACSGSNDENTLYIWSVYPLYAGYEMQLTIEPNHPYALYTKYIVDKFHETYPDVEVKIVDKGWGDSLNENIIRSMQGGEQPDLVGTEVYNQNYIAVDYFSKLNLTEEQVANYVPSALIGNYDADGDGKSGDLYAAPLMTGAFSFCYNEQLMLNAGCPKVWNEELNGGEGGFELLVPETWAEVLYCAELVNNYLDTTYTDKTVREGYGAYIINNVKGIAAGFRAQAYMRLAGGDFVNFDALGTQIGADDLSIDSAENLDAITLMSILGMYTPKNSYALSGTSAETAITDYLKNGKVAMGIEYPSFAAKLDPDYIKFASLPVFTKGDNFTPYEYSASDRDPAERLDGSNVMVGNVCAGIPKSSTKKEYAQHLINCILSDESQEMLFYLDMRIPVTKSGMSTVRNSERSETVDFATRLDSLLSQIENTYSEDPVMIYGGLPCFKKNYSNIWTAFQVLTNSMYNPSNPSSVGLVNGKTGDSYNVDGNKVKEYLRSHLTQFSDAAKAQLR